MTTQPPPYEPVAEAPTEVTRQWVRLLVQSQIAFFLIGAIYGAFGFWMVTR